tara:strand:+ start:511 stop:780 length:270 start_codon:yes stop_codon:yes gene_type:complete
MKIKGAMTILNKRCEFYGWTFDELIERLDNGWDDNNSVIVAYEVFKMHQGLVWSGYNGDGWATREKRDEQYIIWKNNQNNPLQSSKSVL